MTTPDELKTADPVRAALAERLLDDAADYFDTMFKRHGVPMLERGIDPAKLRACAAALRTPAPLHSGELAKRADAAIKSLRGSDHKALVTSYSVAQSLAEVIEGLLLHSGEPVAWRWQDLEDYLEFLEQEIIGADLDLKLPANLTSPGIWADRIRALYTSPPAIELDGGVPWWKILADNWRGRNGNSTTGDSVRNSCADELEKSAQRALAVPKPERAVAREALTEQCAHIAETVYSRMFPEPANRITAENAGHTAAREIRALSPVALPDGNQQ